MPERVVLLVLAVAAQVDPAVAKQDQPPVPVLIVSNPTPAIAGSVSVSVAPVTAVVPVFVTTIV